jgi:hypothetical protein
MSSSIKCKTKSFPTTSFGFETAVRKLLKTNELISSVVPTDHSVPDGLLYLLESVSLLAL